MKSFARFNLLAVALMFFNCTTACAEDVSIEEKLLEVFKAKTCLECHGSDVAKPKDFGHLDDFTKLAQDAELITPGDADDSELFFQVDAGLMPPPDSGTAPLNAEQLALLRTWIESLPAPQIVDEPAEAQTPLPPPQEKPTLPTGQRWLRWFGKFHPATVHFPIAFLVGALIAEFWRITTGRETVSAATRFCLWLGALAAPLAALLGWLHAHHSGYTQWFAFNDTYLSVNLHRWLGIIVAVGAWLTLALYEISIRKNSSRLRAYVSWAMLTLAIATLLTGFFGGLVTYGGLKHYAF